MKTVKHSWLPFILFMGAFPPSDSEMSGGIVKLVGINFLDYIRNQ